MSAARFELTRSIIHNCPALRFPQSFVERMGGVAQIVVLKGSTPEQAQYIVDACNAAAPKFQAVHCSQCGQSFGPGNSGYSACSEHAPLGFSKEWCLAAAKAEEEAQANFSAGVPGGAA